MHHRDIHARCLAVIQECNTTLTWGLDGDAQRQYAAAISSYLDDGVLDEDIYAVVANYHNDHALVAALRDAQRPEHDAAWEQWMRRVVGVLQSAQLIDSDDIAVDSDDLAQIARVELVRALPSYRYGSRFSSWAYRVVVQSVKAHRRNSWAAKRAMRPDSLDQLSDGALPADTIDRAESHANARLLRELIAAVLAEQPDRRLGSLFQFWAIEDKRVVEIGELMHLHPSRVRALLQLARQVLQEHPEIRAWYESESEGIRTPVRQRAMTCSETTR